jgi:hypothetical protein
MIVACSLPGARTGTWLPCSGASPRLTWACRDTRFAALVWPACFLTSLFSVDQLSALHRASEHAHECGCCSGSASHAAGDFVAVRSRVAAGAMQVGDVSAHHGWTLHMAEGQAPGSRQRLALAVSFFGDGARVLDWSRDRTLRPELRAQQFEEDCESYDSWYSSLKGASFARHADLPLVFDGS